MRPGQWAVFRGADYTPLFWFESWSRAFVLALHLDQTYPHAWHFVRLILSDGKFGPPQNIPPPE